MKEHSLMKIGLTGGIASGKNFIAKLFEEKGCYTLDADTVARLVVEPNGLAYEAVVQEFGSQILDNDGKINRKVLRETVVGNPERLKQLEQLIHPAVATYSKRWSGEILGRDSKAILIYHAPLLLEAGQDVQYDSIILIYCSEETQLERLRKRGYPPYEDAIKLMSKQMPYAEKLCHANFVLDNDSTEENARAEVERIYGLLKIMRYGMKHKNPLLLEGVRRKAGGSDP